MSYRNLMLLWLLIGGMLAYEHVALNYAPAISILYALRDSGLLDKGIELSTAPGRPISYYYGIIGFGIMLCTNFYILRKRLPFMKRLGDLRRWLDIHIFFGAMGPTFIVFHSGFKVRGIVAISFWSMVIASVSGFLGRYFYVKASLLKNEYQELLNKVERDVKNNLPAEKASDDTHLKEILQMGFQYMGGRKLDGKVGLLELPVFLVQTMTGDLKSILRVPVLSAYAGTAIDTQLKVFGRLKRNEVYADTYCRLLSYWHTFHLPFTFFMWITAVVHIISSLIFKV